MREHMSTADLGRDVICLLGLPFDVTDMASAVRELRVRAASGRRCFISTPNLSFAMGARADAAFRNSVLRSDLCLVDGMPLVWVSRLLGLPIRQRVSGAGLFESLASQAPPILKVFFFGGVEGAAAAAAERVNREATGLRCVGFDMPGYGSIEDMSRPEQLARIDASQADFVVVALGAQKGQAWIERNRARLAAPLICHLGAVVNFAAGRIARAPNWVQSVGLEWLWRIKEEPELWRRYWKDGRAFFSLLVLRVLPYAVLSVLRPRSLAEPLLAIEWASSRATIKMGGAWTRPCLGPLREALSRAHAEGRSVQIDLAHVTYVDSAFVGLMLIARGAFGSSGLILAGAGSAIRRIFHFNVAEYLLDSTPTGLCESLS